MFNKEMFFSKKGKVVNVIMTGTGGAVPGMVVDCSDRFLTLSTRWSSQQHFALEQVQSFWCNDNLPIEE